MLKISVLFALLFISGTLSAQEKNVHSDTNKDLITEISELIKKNSLFKDSLHWKEINEGLDSPGLTQTNNSIDRQLIFDFFTLLRSGSWQSSKNSELLSLNPFDGTVITFLLLS